MPCEAGRITVYGVFHTVEGALTLVCGTKGTPSLEVLLLVIHIPQPPQLHDHPRSTPSELLFPFGLTTVRQLASGRSPAEYLRYAFKFRTGCWLG